MKKIACLLIIILLLNISFICTLSVEVNAQIYKEWVARYNGSGNGHDNSIRIECDPLGNVIVMGESGGIGTGGDYTTIKYDSLGNILWTAIYNPEDGNDRPHDMTVDQEGNIYVTGECGYLGIGSDSTTIKYDPNGNLLWSARYNGPGNGWDAGHAIFVDSSENVYVTGMSYGGGDTGYDIFTVKYGSDGNQEWVARYDGPGNQFQDNPFAITVDFLGNVFITGECEGAGTVVDIVTIKYDVNSNQEWVRTYNGPYNADDRGVEIALHPSGNIIVAGVSRDKAPWHGGTDLDYTTIAYDTSGNQLWVAKYNGPANGYDLLRDMVIDSQGNIFVTGWSGGPLLGYEVVTIKYNSSGNQLWIVRDNGEINDMTMDSLGNIYLVGRCSGPDASWDIITIAYDPLGNLIWKKEYNDPSKSIDLGNAISLDGSRNVYITGTTQRIGSYRDFITIKYSEVPPNIPPVAHAGSDQVIGEGELFLLDASASYDPDGTIETYEWDLDLSNGLWWETGATPDLFGISRKHIFGDDGTYTVTLRVTDNGGEVAMHTCNVTVNNISPKVTIESASIDIEVGIRVAGRKLNNIELVHLDEGHPNVIHTFTRAPGSPDQQITWISFSYDLTKDLAVTLTPSDPKNVGANPVWVYIKLPNGNIKELHHTFNIPQSKKKDSDHWNHIDPWILDLNPELLECEFKVDYHITDPGSDDEILTYTYGSQVKTVIYLNNPPNPDPYPSPEVNPVDITDTTTLIYEGPGTVTLVVKDDDGGFGTVSLNIG